MARAKRISDEFNSTQWRARARQTRSIARAMTGQATVEKLESLALEYERNADALESDSNE